MPGPTYVPRAVREAMTADLVGHRSEAFAELYRSVTPIDELLAQA